VAFKSPDSSGVVPSVSSVSSVVVTSQRSPSSDKVYPPSHVVHISEEEHSTQ